MLSTVKVVKCREIVEIAAGVGHSLALFDDSTVYSWGDNQYGQLGIGSAVDDTNTPVKVRGEGGLGYLEGIVGIAAGLYYSMALKGDGTVYTWGYNDVGQLGDSTTDTRYYPVQVRDSSGGSSLSEITAISCGSIHCMALGTDNKVWAWGGNREGGLGIGTSDYNAHSLPIRVERSGGGFLEGVWKIAAGSAYSTVILNDSTAWAWGANGNGQLGNDTTRSEYYPIPVYGPEGVDTLKEIFQISPCPNGPFYIYGHTLALKDDSTVWAWGRNGYGQLGNGILFDQWTPVQTLGPYGSGHLEGISYLATGIEHSLALHSEGTVWAWGDNYFGTLGDNTSVDKPWPVQVHGPDDVGYLTDILKIATGHRHCLALRSDGTLWAWGRNTKGQLGDGTAIHKYYPVLVNTIPVGINTGKPPVDFSISCHPNPFNAKCKIEIIGDHGMSYSVEIHDMLGKMVEKGKALNGVYIWEPLKSTGSGVYLVRINSSNLSLDRKIIYLK
ncbi:T9SS type A sorting domain-containing protein [bacterium]|nr:T9SS type A sorting domain-containing protein [bacterium]